MRTRGFLTAALLACACALAWPGGAAAHKYYTSLARAEYNEGTKAVEFALRVFADDLELALTRRSGRKVYLDKTKDADELALAYLRETFEVAGRDGRRVELRWVGMEAQGDVAWLYFEAPLPEGPAGATLRDRVLLELFQTQVNIINLKYGGRKLDLVFKRGDDGPRRIP